MRTLLHLISVIRCSNGILPPTPSLLRISPFVTRMYTTGCTQATIWNNFMPKDDKRAVELFNRGCDIGDRGGCRVMGFMYERGLGVAKDLEDGLILINTTLNGALVKFIVDTSGTTALGAKLMPSSGLPDSPSETLESLHGRSAVYPTRVEWSFDGTTVKIPAVVGALTFPDGTDGILGADILERFKSARFDFHNSVLILEDP